MKNNKLEDDVEYNINIEAIHNIKFNYRIKQYDWNAFIEKSITDQILFFIQNLHYYKNKQDNDFMYMLVFMVHPKTGNRNSKNNR